MNRLKVLSFAIGLAGLLMTMQPSSRLMGATVTFPGPELLGRPEATSITINVVASAAINAYFKYGTAKGAENLTSPTFSAAANQPLVAVLSNLTPDTQYYYYTVYQQSGGTTWTTRPEYSFHTARAPGSKFTFTVTSDSHINIVFGNGPLFTQTLKNIAGESPDFDLDLGDTFAMDSVTTQAQANSNYLNIRTNYFSLISPSVPIFLALGNHEQEEGWHMSDPGLSVEPPIMSANARNEYFLNPDPLVSTFYTGNADQGNSGIKSYAGGSSTDQTIEDYYAWTWGDGLFLVIDPYWYTPQKPYVGNMGGGEPGYPTASDPASDADRWQWTLGLTQYQWLQNTLAGSTAKYKFVFAHQVAGGMDDYGRGGAYAVPYVEWGGTDPNATTYSFGTKRSGWPYPVHQLLVKYNVTAFFHGHDHEYAHEQRDGVVYQLVPMAADATYGYGFADYTVDGTYTLKVLPNSGHLQVTVDPNNGVTVAYVRAYTSGAGTNGTIADSYVIPAPVGGTTLSVSSLTLSPSTLLGDGSSSTTGTVTLNGPVPFNSNGVQVTLTNSNPLAATVGTQSVLIPSGSSSSTFTATSQLVTSSAATTTITATATANATGSAQATLTVNPVATGMASLTLNPTTVVGGGSNSTSTGTVTLNGYAPAGGIVVALSSSSSNPAAATVPASVTVPYNSTSNTFQITTSSVTSSTTVTVTATLNGSKTATLTVNPTPAFTPVRINSGGPKYTDSLAQVWSADTGYSGGSAYSTTQNITNTSDPTLYKTSRYGTSFTYTISAPAGNYLVTLKFAEPVWNAKGKRVFNVAINGTAALSNFDIFAAAGAEFKAVDETFAVKSTGTISIKFTQGSAGSPLVNAIQVVASP